MNHFFLFGLLGLVVVLVITLGVLHWSAEKRRSEALRALAARHGWRFAATDQHARGLRWGRFEPFRQGSGHCSNILSGREEDGAFEVFEHEYQGSRYSKQYYNQVCVLEMPIAAPKLSIQEEHVGHKMLDAAGAEDINFESNEFSERFWVQCDVRRFAYDVIHTGTMEFLLQVPGWHWQWRGHTLVVYRPGILRAKEVPAILGMALRFRRLLPRHLVATQQEAVAAQR